MKTSRLTAFTSDEADLEGVIILTETMVLLPDGDLVIYYMHSGVYCTLVN